AGSWINHNFAIWVGHDDDNTAWDALHAAREHLTRRQGDKETGRQGDKETGRQGDRETGRQGDKETSADGSLSLSPWLPVSLSDSSVSLSAFDRAWEEIYIAEGSDWFWWYGDEHSSAQDALFDYLFRKHLQNVYLLLGDQPPPELGRAINRRSQRQTYTL